jgi:DivIVA domain-containing protein
MDPTRLAAELTEGRFGTTQLRQGYDVREVDDFVDEVVQALRSGVPAGTLAERVRSVRFTTSTFQRGYDMADVDAALESVVGTLERATATGGSPATAAPPVQRTEPARRPGLMGRLLAAARGDQPLR